MSKRNVDEHIDLVMNKTPKQVVKEPVEKENCSYFINILLKRKEIARELALLSTNLGGLMGSAAQSLEKLILGICLVNLGWNTEKETADFVVFIEKLVWGFLLRNWRRRVDVRNLATGFCAM